MNKEDIIWEKNHLNRLIEIQVDCIARLGNIPEVIDIFKKICVEMELGIECISSSSLAIIDAIDAVDANIKMLEGRRKMLEARIKS